MACWTVGERIAGLNSRCPIRALFLKPVMSGESIRTVIKLKHNMIHEKKLKAVLFDMDGVLLDSEEYICRAGMMMFKEKGHEVSPEDFLEFRISLL